MSLSLIQVLFLMDVTVVRMVSRRDVEVVVENVKSLLFRTGPDSLKRMSLYLRSGRQGVGNVSSILSGKKKRLLF